MIFNPDNNEPPLVKIIENIRFSELGCCIYNKPFCLILDRYCLGLINPILKHVYIIKRNVLHILIAETFSFVCTV